MKFRAFLIPVSALLLTLSACNLNLNPFSGEEEGDHLPYAQDQAKNKLRELGEGDGFEIVYHAFDESDERIEDYTFGMKGSLTWSYDDGDKAAWKFENNTLTSYRYDAETSAYEAEEPIEDAQELYEGYVVAVTSMFYLANSYDGLPGFTKVRDLTYIGRSASEYHYDVTVLGAGEVHVAAIIDNAVGITLFWDATGKNYQEGDTGSATFEVTEFKTGSQVVAPVVA